MGGSRNSPTASGSATSTPTAAPTLSNPQAGGNNPHPSTAIQCGPSTPPTSAPEAPKCSPTTSMPTASPTSSPASTPTATVSRGSNKNAKATKSLSSST